MRNVLIVGGGAAGMMAAIGAKEAGARVILLEGNEKLGKKLYITGKGRCNVTNACPPERFRQSVVRNPRFLYSALALLSPDALMDKLTAWGCPVMVERGERAFPRSEKASDVTRALEARMRALGVQVKLNTRAGGLITEDGRVTGVHALSGEALYADAVVLATGGFSYPSTGSTGDGYRFLSAMGCEMIAPKPALSALCCENGWVTELMGLSLKNVTLTLETNAPKKKTLFSELGEMLFTHFGVSGPLVLSASSYMAGLNSNELTLTLDLKPALTNEQLDARLLRDLGAAGKKRAQTVLCGLYPQRLADAIARMAGIAPDALACEMTRETRAALCRMTKALPLPVTGFRPMEEAIITAGGLSVKELDPKSMAVKCVPGLYAAGELIDVDALTGGFNLHIAFSTGYLAGQSAATEA